MSSVFSSLSGLLLRIISGDANPERHLTKWHKPFLLLL